jgi:hypothetical protein
MSKQRYLKVVRFERKTRYYLLLLGKDLLDDWVITRVNGRIGSRLGRIVNEFVGNKTQGLERFNELCQYREERRRYNRIEIY